MSTQEVLTDVLDYLDLHVTFASPGDRLIVALWIVHTHVIEAFSATPYLWITGPHGSGKTDLAQAITDLALRAEHAYGPTIAAQRRFQEPISPNHDAPCTLIIDEFDHLLESVDRGGMWAILLGGYKRGAVTLNAADIGPGVERRGLFYPRTFVGRYVTGYPDAFVSRTIPIAMRQQSIDAEATLDQRRPAATLTAPIVHDLVLRWTTDDPGLIGRLRRNVSDDQVVKQLHGNDPLRGRDAEVWGPLLAIAHDAGPEIGAQLREIAVRTTAADDRIVHCPADDLDDMIIDAATDISSTGKRRLALRNWYDPAQLPVPPGVDSELTNERLACYSTTSMSTPGRLGAVYLAVDAARRRAQLRFDLRTFDRIVRGLGCDARDDRDPQRHRGAWTRDTALRAFDEAGRLGRDGKHRTQNVYLFRGDKAKRRCVVVDWSHMFWPDTTDHEQEG